MYVYCGQSTAAASNMAAVVEARDKYAAVMDEVRARVCKLKRLIRNIYNFIHHQTMIANSEKQTNRNNKELGYINYHRTKSVTTQPIFSSKNITSFFNIVLGRSKLNCTRQ